MEIVVMKESFLKMLPFCRYLKRMSQFITQACTSQVTVSITVKLLDLAPRCQDHRHHHNHPPPPGWTWPLSLSQVQAESMDSLSLSQVISIIIIFSIPAITVSRVEIKLFNLDNFSSKQPLSWWTQCDSTLLPLNWRTSGGQEPEQ